MKLPCEVGAFFNTTRLNISCSVSQLKCVSGSNFSKPAKVVELVNHNHCCAYRHRARGPEELFDEFYKGTVLDRYRNFTLFLEIDQNVTVPEKCLNITCRQVEGIPVLSSGKNVNADANTDANAVVSRDRLPLLFLLLPPRFSLPRGPAEHQPGGRADCLLLWWGAPPAPS